MDITTRQEQEITIVDLNGRFDAATVDRFKGQINQLIDQGSQRFVLNLKNVNYVDSGGLGSLVSILRRVNEEKGLIRLVEPSQKIRSLLDLTRLTRLFDIYDDLSAAIKSCGQL